MSNYTPKMEAEMREQESWNYEQAVAYAEQHPDLSTRSVISKVKSLGLAYTPKPAVTKSATPQVRKSDIVNAIAQAVNANSDALAGLAKADKNALTELTRAIETMQNV